MTHVAWRTGCVSCRVDAVKVLRALREAEKVAKGMQK